jgi:hypothetical protein
VVAPGRVIAAAAARRRARTSGTATQHATTTPSAVMAIAGPSALPLSASSASSASSVRSTVAGPREVPSEVARPTTPYTMAAMIGIVRSPIAMRVRRFVRADASRGAATVGGAGISSIGSSIAPSGEARVPGISHW